MAIQTFTVPPGTDPAPAVASARPGDRIVFKPGGHRRVKAFGRLAGGTFDGEPDRPITLFFEPGAEITLASAGSPTNPDGSPATTGEGINLEGCSWVVIDGATVRGMTFGARKRLAGIRAVEGAGITVKNAIVSGCRTWGVFFGFVDDLRVIDSVLEGSIEQHGLYLSNSFRGASVVRVLSRNNNNCGVHINGDLETASSYGKPLTGIAEDIVIEDFRAENNGAGGGAAFNLDGVDGCLLRRCVASGNRAAALTLFRGNGAIPSTRVAALHCNFDNPGGSRATIMVNDGAGPFRLWHSRAYNPDPNRPELVCPADMYDGDYNELSRWHPDSDAAVKTLAEFKAATGKDKASVPHPGPLPAVPAGVPDPGVPVLRYAGRGLVMGFPPVLTLATPTPVVARLTNAGTETWVKGGIVKVAITNTYPDDPRYGNTRLLLVDDAVAPGDTGRFEGTVTPMQAGPVEYSLLAEGLAWLKPAVAVPYAVRLPFTRAEFDALAGRVAKLEAGGGPGPAVADYAFEVIGISAAVASRGRAGLATVTVQNVGRKAWAAGGPLKLGIDNPRDDGRFGNSRLELTNGTAPGEAGIFAAYLTVGERDDVFRAVPLIEGDRWLPGPAADVPVRAG